MSGLTTLAKQFGTPIALRTGREFCDKLRPVNASLAKPNSLSRKYSLGEFPCHSDTAHWLTPCRFVILACLSPGAAGRQTLLLDTNRLPLDRNQKDLLHRAQFRIENGRNSFFGKILSKGRSFIRYDPGCMVPLGSEGECAMDVLSKMHWLSRIEEIRWTQGQVLIIDNWRVLHGRAAAQCSDQDRILLRVLVR
jgi:alpha-ketoglutarate-dependent taurine dioxygenase